MIPPSLDPLPYGTLLPQITAHMSQLQLSGTSVSVYLIIPRRKNSKLTVILKLHITLEKSYENKWQSLFLEGKRKPCHSTIEIYF